MEETHSVLVTSVFSSFLRAGFGVLWPRGNRMELKLLSEPHSSEEQEPGPGGSCGWELCCLFSSVSISPDVHGAAEHPVRGAPWCRHSEKAFTTSAGTHQTVTDRFSTQ